MLAAALAARGEFYPEDFLIQFAARHVGRPVRWLEDRREHLTAMNHETTSGKIAPKMMAPTQ